MASVIPESSAARLERIMVGVDFSSESESAVLHAAQVARQKNARLILAHVLPLPADLVEDSSYDPFFRAQEAATELGTRHRNEAGDLLLATAARCEALGVQCETLLIDDNPSDGLARAADEVGADLLVVGTQGRTGLKRFLLGSVAERTVRLASVNTLVARGPIEEVSGYRRIMVATDFSAASDAALAVALAIATPDARIEAVHAWLTRATPTGVTVAPVRDELERAVVKRGERFLQDRAGASPRVSFVPLEASAADGICRRAEQDGTDLIVAGSHGRRGVRRLLLGSVAETVVRHAPCSVLVVHPLAPAAR